MLVTLSFSPLSHVWVCVGVEWKTKRIQFLQTSKNEREREREAGIERCAYTLHAMVQVMHEAMQSGNPQSMMSNPEFQASLQEMMQVILVVLIQLNQYELVQMGDG